MLAGVTSNALLASKEKTLARRVGEGAVYFGWLGLLIAWISIASNGFNALNPADQQRIHFIPCFMAML